MCVCWQSNVQCLSGNTRFLGFLFREVMLKHQRGEVRKYFLSNTSAKNYCNRIECVSIIASQNVGRFCETQCTLVRIHFIAHVDDFIETSQMSRS